MEIEMSRTVKVALYASAALIGLYASYIAYLVVPGIVRTVVPVVVEKVIGS